MKVLLASSGSGSRGGGEHYLYLLACALHGSGHEVHLCVPEHSRMEEFCRRVQHSATVHQLRVKNTYDRVCRNFGAVLDFRARRIYMDAFRRIRPDVIHINQQVLEDSLDVVLAAEQTSYPYVITTHVTHGAGVLGARFGRLRDALSENILSRIKCPLITVSGSSRNTLLGRIGGPLMAEGRVRVIYNGVEFFECIEPSKRRAIRAEWGAMDDTPVIGAVGRVEAQKDPMFFVCLMANLRAANPNFKAIWIGDGSLSAEMLDLARQLGVQPHFVLDGWREDVADRLQALDIFVLPSRFEGLPFALQEAMSSGLPACVSDVDGMEEVVQSGESGYVCRADDLADWTARLSDLLRNRPQRDLLGRNSRAFATQNFSKAAMLNSTLGVYTVALRAGR